MPQTKSDSAALAVGKFIGGLANITFMVFVILLVSNPWLIGYAAFDLLCTFMLVSVAWFRDQLR